MSKIEVNFKDYKEDYKKWCDYGLENIYDNGEILFFK